LTDGAALMTMATATAHPTRTMNLPPNPAEPGPRHVPTELQMRSWLKLKRELIELNARLEYLRLIMSLGVRRIR
jgi:hypothetical protein